MKFLTAFLFLFCFSVFADSASWDVEKAVPKVTVIGEESPQYEAAAEKMRARLVEQLTYWRDRGLTRPPELEGVYIFSEPGEVKVKKVMEVLNPSMSNFMAHFIAQRTALENSEFVRVLKFQVRKIAEKQAAKAKKGKKSWLQIEAADGLIDWLFDYYCLIRYGFAVEGTFAAVTEDGRLVDSKPALFSPGRDNAIYGRFPRIDLSDILLPAQVEDEEAGKIRPQDWVRVSALNAIFRDQSKASSLYSRRIVILPRTTEGTDPSDIETISSVSDPTIDRHENGHHMNSTLARDHQGLHRMLEEIYADYLAQAPTGNPIVGQFFAEASGIVAARLKSRTDLNPDEVRLMRSLERLGERGQLRTFETDKTISTIDRSHIMSNSYDGGDPARGFLWRIRGQLTPEQQLRFDELTIKVIQEVGRVPAVVSRNASYALMVRGFIRSLIKKVETSRQLKKVFAEEGPEIEVAFEMATEHIINNPELLQEIVTSPNQKGKAEAILRRVAAEVVTPDGFNASVEAEMRAGDRIRKKENRSKWVRGFLSLIGLDARARVEADYVLAELFRTYASLAQKEYPELRALIVQEAGVAMNATPKEYQLQDGSLEIVFVKRSWTPAFWLARNKLARILETRAGLREDWEALQAARSSMDPEEFAGYAAVLEERYARNLEGLQEFERTNSLRRLYAPFPLMRMARKAMLTFAKGGSGADAEAPASSDDQPVAAVVSGECSVLLQALVKDRAGA